ncbi:hypothetical protein TorRG33x02_122140, partial [Trema orientale]
MSSEIKAFLRATAAEAQRFLFLEESSLFRNFVSGKSHNFDSKSLSSSSTGGGALLFDSNKSLSSSSTGDGASLSVSKSLSSSSTTTVGGALFVVLFTPNVARGGRGGYTDIPFLNLPEINVSPNRKRPIDLESSHQPTKSKTKSSKHK